VLFFAAVLVTSLIAGVGPAICAALLSVPLGAYTFLVRAGYPLFQAVFQSLLFSVDGIVVVYLAFLMRQGREAVQDTNRQLRESEEKYRALFDSIDEGFCVVEVLFDDADNALDYRFLEVNRAFEEQTGISNAVGRWIREILPANEEYWFQIYGQIALTGEPRRFENPALALGRFFDVYAYRFGMPEQRQVAILFNDITKRKQAEEVLRRTQALNQAVLGSLAANIAVLDREGNIIAVNEAWKRFAYENDGAAVADSVGVNYLQACSDAPESRDGGWAARNGIQAVLDRTLPNFVLEYPCHSPSQKRWFLMSVTPLLGEGGGAVVSHTDITKRKQVEEALQESEERLELAMEAGGIGTFEWNIRTNAVVWTERPKATGRASGASRGVYDDWAKRVVPEDLLVCEASIQEAFRKKQRHWQAEYRRMSSDTAEERWINSQSHIFYDAQGEPLRMIGVNVDITERKRAEEELRVLSAELRQTLHTASTGLTHCSRDLRYISANPAYAQWIGLPLEQIIGRPIVEVMGQAAFEIIRPRIERVLNGERVEYEDELPIAGERKWIHADYTPDRDASGNVVGWVASVMDITVRKRIEEELRAANAFLDAIIENIPLMLFIKESQSLRFVRINRAGEDLLGWPKETLIGKNDYDFWSKEQAECFVEKDLEALETGSVVEIPEEPILTRYRGVRILHTKKVPILDTTGNRIYLLGISEDITERKRIEKEQQFLAHVSVALSSSLEYEQTLATLAQLVVQNIADWCAVDVMDEQGQLMRLKVASADPSEAALCAVLEQLPPDRDLPHLMRSVIESKRPIVIEQVTLQYIESLVQGPGHLQGLLAAGVTSFVAVPLLMRGQVLGALFLGSSTLSRVIGQGDLHLAEALADRAAMAIENARLYRASVRATQLQQLLAEAVAALATSLDYEQTLATVAHLVVRDFADWCLVEVIDERAQIRRRKVVAGDPSKADLCAILEHMTIDRDRPHLLRAVFETKQSLFIEHVTSEHLESAAQGPEHLQALRAVNPTSLMAVPLLRHGQILGILAFVSSTEYRRYGRSDLRLAEALAERAAVAIENARLYRASVHATQLRDQVLAVVAHDLRNPLSTILLQASVVKRHGPEPERRSQKPMEVIERAARRMNRLIQDLLDVALMEAGQLTIERARLSAGGLIAEAVDMQRPLASSSSLELRVQVDPDVPEVWGDRDRLLQVFENLIGNAIKFTQAGGRITAGATSRDDEVVFWVADTGCGIPSENLPRVFDRFWQATRAGRQGAGLGLPITKGIVEAHGGRIWVESTAGSGSTFFFTIPRASAAQDRLSDRRRPDRVA
jgi:PAS domain S-box-containing protein